MPRLPRLLLMTVCGLLLVVALAPALAQDPLATPDPDATPMPTLAPPTRPAPAVVITEGDYTLELLFDGLVQGEAGVLRVDGPDLTGGRLRFLNRFFDLFAVEGEPGLFGLVAVGIAANPRDYPLLVQVQTADGDVSLATEVPVTTGGFIQQAFNLPPDRAYLTDPELERNEFARLEVLFDSYTDQRGWADGGFQLPLDSQITSPFGAFRTLNQTTQTRHTGWDLRAAVGTPLMAVADGTVAWAGPLDVRGNHVILDHGHGVFSGYAHLSQIHVTRGQQIRRGQFLGATGNTGRSNGPHLHWEITVNGEWVDGLDFVRRWLP